MSVFHIMIIHIIQLIFIKDNIYYNLYHNILCCFYLLVYLIIIFIINIKKIINLIYNKVLKPTPIIQLSIKHKSPKTNI